MDILVNNAGITRDGLLLRMSDEDWDAVLGVNLKGAFLFTESVGRTMLKQRSGAIVNIASIVGVMGNAGQANYSASKAGLIGFTKTVAKELASRGIRCQRRGAGVYPDADDGRAEPGSQEDADGLHRAEAPGLAGGRGQRGVVSGQRSVQLRDRTGDLRWMAAWRCESEIQAQTKL